LLFLTLLPPCHLAHKPVTGGDLSSPDVRRTCPVMSRLPQIPHVDIPGAVLELADLPNVHPAPIVANFNFVGRADPDRSSRFPQQHPFSRSDNPCANPLPPLGPHTHVHNVSPVIENLNGATCLVIGPCRARLPIGDLSSREEREKHQN